MFVKIYFIKVFQLSISYSLILPNSSQVSYLPHLNSIDIIRSTNIEDHNSKVTWVFTVLIDLVYYIVAFKCTRDPFVFNIQYSIFLQLFRCSCVASQSWEGTWTHYEVSSISLPIVRYHHQCSIVITILWYFALHLIHVYIIMFTCILKKVKQIFINVNILWQIKLSI